MTAVIDLTQRLPRHQDIQDIQRRQKVQKVAKVEHATAPQLEVVHHVNEQGKEVV